MHAHLNTIGQQNSGGGGSLSKKSSFNEIAARNFMHSHQFNDAILCIDNAIQSTPKHNFSTLGNHFYLRGKIFQTICTSEEIQYPFTYKKKQNSNKTNKIFSFQSDILQETIACYRKAYKYFSGLGDEIRQAKVVTKIGECYLDYLFIPVMLQHQSFTTINKVPLYKTSEITSLTITTPITTPKSPKHNPNNQTSSQTSSQASSQAETSENTQDNNNSSNIPPSSSSSNNNKSNRSSTSSTSSSHFENEFFEISFETIESPISLGLDISSDLSIPFLCLQNYMNMAELHLLKGDKESAKNFWEECSNSLFNCFIIPFAGKYVKPGLLIRIQKILKRVIRVMFCFDQKLINRNLILLDSYNLIEISIENSLQINPLSNECFKTNQESDKITIHKLVTIHNERKVQIPFIDISKSKKEQELLKKLNKKQAKRNNITSSRLSTTVRNFFNDKEDIDWAEVSPPLEPFDEGTVHTFGTLHCIKALLGRYKPQSFDKNEIFMKNQKQLQRISRLGKRLKELAFLFSPLIPESSENSSSSKNDLKSANPNLTSSTTNLFSNEFKSPSLLSQSLHFDENIPSLSIAFKDILEKCPIINRLVYILLIDGCTMSYVPSLDCGVKVQKIKRENQSSNASGIINSSNNINTSSSSNQTTNINNSQNSILSSSNNSTNNTNSSPNESSRDINTTANPINNEVNQINSPTTTTNTNVNIQNSSQSIPSSSINTISSNTNNNLPSSNIPQSGVAISSSNDLLALERNKFFIKVYPMTNDSEYGSFEVKQDVTLKEFLAFICDVGQWCPNLSFFGLDDRFGKKQSSSRSNFRMKGTKGIKIPIKPLLQDTSKNFGDEIFSLVNLVTISSTLQSPSSLSSSNPRSSSSGGGGSFSHHDLLSSFTHPELFFAIRIEKGSEVHLLPLSGSMNHRIQSLFTDNQQSTLTLYIYASAFSPIVTEMDIHSQITIGQTLTISPSMISLLRNLVLAKNDKFYDEQSHKRILNDICFRFYDWMKDIIPPAPDSYLHRNPCSTPRPFDESNSDYMEVSSFPLMLICSPSLQIFPWENIFSSDVTIRNFSLCNVIHREKFKRTVIDQNSDNIPNFSTFNYSDRNMVTIEDDRRNYCFENALAKLSLSSLQVCFSF